MHLKFNIYAFTCQIHSYACVMQVLLVLSELCETQDVKHLRAEFNERLDRCTDPVLQVLNNNTRTQAISKDIRDQFEVQKDKGRLSRSHTIMILLLSALMCDIKYEL